MARHGTLSVVLAFVLTGLSSAVVGMRFWSRRVMVGKVKAADWVMLVALITAWFSVVVNWYVIQFLDYRGVHDRASFAQTATRALLTIWIYRLNYILDLCLIKTSILLFYASITTSRALYHRTVRVLLAVIFLGSASMIVAAVFTCYPISDAWSFDVFERGFYGIYATQCYNPGPFWLANAGYNLVTDVLIWTLPIVFFLNLKSMQWRRRMELVGIFSIGFFAVVGSAMRLRVIRLWLSDWVQQGENLGNVMIWSQVEQNVGIIAGSIPFLRPIFRKALARARSLSPSPGGCLVKEGSPSLRAMPRTPIIPSPSPTWGGSREVFSMPGELEPVERVRMRAEEWGVAGGIWDGSQKIEYMSG